MGLIKGALVVLASTIFFLAVLSSAIFYTIGTSLDHAAVEGNAIDLAGKISSGLNLTQELTSKMAVIKSTCRTAQNYLINYGQYTFRVSCTDANKSISVMLNDTIKNFVNDLYYEEYNCNFLDCFSKYSPTFLISAKSQNYLFRLLYFSLTALILSAAALFLLTNKKRYYPFVTGFFIILSALILLGLGNLLNSFSNNLVATVAGIFFSKAEYISTILFIAGSALLLVGLIIELYRVEFKIYKMFSKMEESAKISNLQKQVNEKSSSNKK